MFGRDRGNFVCVGGGGQIQEWRTKDVQTGENKIAGSIFVCSFVCFLKTAPLKKYF